MSIGYAIFSSVTAKVTFIDAFVSKKYITGLKQEIKSNQILQSGTTNSLLLRTKTLPLKAINLKGTS